MKNKVINLSAILLCILIVFHALLFIKSKKSDNLEEITNVKFESIKSVEYKADNINLEDFLEEYKNAKFVKTNQYKKYQKKYRNTQEAFELNIYICHDKDGRELYTISYIIYDGNKFYQIYNSEKSSENENVYYKKIN